MHELSLVSAAIAQAVDAARQAGASRIRRLTFSLPAAGHVTEDSVFEPTNTSGGFALTSIDVLVDD